LICSNFTARRFDPKGLSSGKNLLRHLKSYYNGFGTPRSELLQLRLFHILYALLL